MVIPQYQVCHVCLDTFIDPKTLSCFHTYCKTCMDKHLESHGNDQTLQCPLCRAKTEVPNQDVSKLPTNLATKSSIEDMQDQYQFGTNCKSEEKPQSGVYSQDCDYSILQHLDIIRYLGTMGARSCCHLCDEPLVHSRNSENKDYGILKTIETTPLDLIEYLCTVGARGCQHHEPLLHSRNSQNKEYDQSEDRKRSMNTNSRNMRLQFGDVWSQEICMEFQLEEQQIQDIIHPIHLQRTKFFASMTLVHLLIAASRIEDLPCLQIDFFADKGKNKSKVFLFQGLQGHHKSPCNGTKRSQRFHSKRLLRSMALNSAGPRKRSRDSHIEGLQRSETLHFAGSRQSDRSHFCRSEALPRFQTFKFVGQPTSEDPHSYRTEGLQRSKTSQNESLTRSNTVHYEGLHRLNKLYSHSFNDSTHPLFEGTQGFYRVLQNALQALRILLILTITRKYCHVVILIAFLTRAACTAVQVPINCTSAAVITSTNYPSTYPQFENRDWSVTAPEGRMILLTFNNFSLGPLGGVTVIDTVGGGKGQSYGEKESTIPPFLSRRNSLLLRFRSDGTPTRNGFNISASCYELSETRVGRLVDGNTPAEGFLELQAESGAKWTRVCKDISADQLAKVVCGELGFAGAKEVSYEQGGCSLEGADLGCIRAPRCENYAYRSQDCSESSEECTSSMAVKVKCFEPGFKGCYDLGNTQLQNGFSYESTSQCITSCRADTSQAIAITNGSECFCSTNDDIRLSIFRQVETQSCALHQLVYNASVGFCNQTDDVMNGSWDSDATWFGSIVHLTCDAGYRLKGNGTLQCVTKMSPYVPVWNGSYPTCELIKNSTSRNSSEATPTHDSEKKGLINAAIAISSSMPALICIICAVVCDKVSNDVE